MSEQLMRKQSSEPPVAHESINIFEDSPAPAPKLWASYLRLALFLVISGLFFWNTLPQVKQHPIKGGDQGQWVTMAFNLSESGVFSNDKAGKPKPPTPTAYREPLYPAFLAAQILLNPNLRNLSIDEGIGKGNIGHPGLVALQYGQVVVLYICAILTGLLGFMLTKRWSVFFLSFYLVGTSSIMHREMLLYRNETFTALLIVISAISLFALAQRKTKMLYAFAGLTTALLTLNKGIYQYYWLVLAAGLLFLAFTKFGERRDWNRKQTLQGVFIFAIAYYALVGPWLLRNKYHFDRFYLTARGGVVLALRAHYDSMSWEEYKASFLYWTPLKSAKAILNENFDVETVTRRINRRHPTHSIYKTARQRRSDLRKIHGNVEADKIQLKESLDYILSHPLRHLAVTIPIAIRGSFIEETQSFFGQKIIGPHISIAIFLCFLSVVSLALISRNIALFVAFLTPLYCWGMYSFVSQNIVRYNIPSAPLLWLASVILVVHFVGAPLLGKSWRLATRPFRKRIWQSKL